MSKVGSPAWLKPTWLFVLCVELQGSGSGRCVSWTRESRLNSRHSPPSEATMNLVCLHYNLSYILCVFVRARCQTHWLWKNNLTGFNLLPPPHPHSLLLLPSFPLHSAFLCSCVPLRGWEFILFGNSMPSLRFLCGLDEARFHDGF